MDAEHEETLISADGLARTLFLQGELLEPIPIFRRTLSVRKRVWGVAHPDSRLSARRFANALFEQGEFSEAARVYREVFELQ